MRLALILILFFSSIDAKIYNVLNYGAIPNDNKDDWNAFQNCINEAIKENNKPYIYVPIGSYNISKELTFDFLDKDVNFIGEINEKKIVPTLNFTSSTNLIWAKGFLFNPSKGIFRVNNFVISSNNLPYSVNHPKVNKDQWNAALAITDKSEAYINNITIKNFYGQGVYISSTQQVGIDENSRFKYVEIINSKIFDVWGYNPKKDDYGDGIYLANISSALIEHNFIFNNTVKTKQLGRGGIVVEYMSENVQIMSNEVKGGYDRPIHIESTFGGHTIQDNLFKGSDMGLILAESIANLNKPILFKNNYFTNEGLEKQNNLSKTYAKGNYGDRALAYIVTNGKSSEMKILFDSNIFFVDFNSQYDSNALINNRSKNVNFKNNSFKTSNSDQTVYIFNYGKSKFYNNIMQKSVILK